MADLHALKQAVERYDAECRNPAMGQFSVGPLYDLFPEKGEGTESCEVSWPTMWPNCHDAGVYALLDEQLNVLYIGKASLRSSIGGRLSSYCAYRSDKTCRLKHDGYWTKTPRYAWSVAVPETTPFEAPALEEFLIRELQPSDNTAGITSAR